MGESTDKIKVLLVDDSAIVRGMLTRSLSKDSRIEVAGSAINGKYAIDMVKTGKFHVIILDIEMPEMDGMTALPFLIKEGQGARIIMSSTLTYGGAEITMRALQLGASDYIQKPTYKGEEGSLEKFNNELLEKIIALGSHLVPGLADKPVYFVEKPIPIPEGVIKSPEPIPIFLAGSKNEKFNLLDKNPVSKPRAIAIGSSTGGPQALFTMLEGIKGKISGLPIFVTQHMPATFTRILAEQLGKISGFQSFEGRDGMEVKPSTLYVAPGNFHMLIRDDNGILKLRITEDPPENFCRPAVDPMLRSLANVYGKNLLTVILTGMGQDGMLGSKEVVAKGGTVIAQDEATSVVWGMPGATAKAGVCRAVMPLKDIPDWIIKAVQGSYT